jgi:hypothetical protein
MSDIDQNLATERPLYSEYEVSLLLDAVEDGIFSAEDLDFYLDYHALWDAWYLARQISSAEKANAEGRYTPEQSRASIEESQETCTRRQRGYEAALGRRVADGRLAATDAEQLIRSYPLRVEFPRAPVPHWERPPLAWYVGYELPPTAPWMGQDDLPIPPPLANPKYTFEEWLAMIGHCDPDKILEA